MSPLFNVEKPDMFPKMVTEFLEEHDIQCDEDLENFSQMVNLLLAEPNVALLVVN